MDIMVVINQMIILFLIMMIGYTAVKVGFVDLDFQKKLSNFILQVTMPLLMLSSVWEADNKEAGQKLFQIFLIAVILYIFLPVIGILTGRLLKVPKNQRDTYTFLMVFSNMGFMGFPVVNSIFGPDAMIYAIIFNMVFNLVQFSYGITLYSGQKMTLNPKTFLSPAVAASGLSILMFLTGVHVRGPVAEAFKSVGGMTTPLAMLVIGISLAGIPLREVFTEKKLYLFTLLRQLIIPAVSYFLLKLFIQDPMILGVSVIIIAMPCATMAVMMANTYNRNIGLSTRAVFLTTLASVITIPIIAALLTM